MNETNFLGDFDILLRSIVSIVVLFILSRAMGKKHIANLTFFDYVVGISIGSIAATFAVDESIPYVHGLIAMVVYGIFPIIVSKASLIGVKPRKILGDKPTILIQRGKLMEENLRKAKFTINDLLEECRLKGAFSICDIDYAILETSGKISILFKPERQPVTMGDAQLPTTYKGIEAELIIDGHIVDDHLKLINRDKNWLMNELDNRKIQSIKEVFFASIDDQGNLNIDLKHHDPKVFDVLE